jgi:hypothetical protein
MKRRTLLKGAATAAAGWVFSRQTRRASADSSQRADAIRIDDPFSGAVFNRRHGEAVDGGLKIRVCGTAKAQRVTVNGRPAQRDNDRFSADVVLRDKVTEIVAVGEGPAGRGEARAKVRWDKHSMPRYRFSIDDNSFFLRDIAQKGYRSLFDCWYLKMLKDLHAKYGVKFTVNIYYTTGDDFSLPQFSDRYRGEWKDNAHWIKLAFHAYANDPDRPYQDAPPEKLITDLDLVAAEIRRFAGEEAYAPPTVIHWAMTRHSAFKPLASRGVRVLSHLTAKNQGKWDINYRWDDVHSEYMATHDAWEDFDSGIVFFQVDIVCNNVPVDRIAAKLDAQIKDPNTAEIMDLFTHEQYFWPFYRNYIPDHPKRLDVALRWVTEHGYKPVFFHEGFLGAPE